MQTTNNMFMMKKSGRVVYDFPWQSKKQPCPWNHQEYRRVVIPFTETEKLHAKPGKKVHVQVVRRAALMPFDSASRLTLKTAGQKVLISRR